MTVFRVMTVGSPLSIFLACEAALGPTSVSESTSQGEIWLSVLGVGATVGAEAAGAARVAAAGAVGVGATAAVVAGIGATELVGIAAAGRAAAGSGDGTGESLSDAPFSWKSRQHQ